MVFLSFRSISFLLYLTQGRESNNTITLQARTLLKYVTASVQVELFSESHVLDVPSQRGENNRSFVDICASFRGGVVPRTDPNGPLGGGACSSSYPAPAAIKPHERALADGARAVSDQA